MNTTTPKQYKATCPELVATLKRDEVKKVKVTSSLDCAYFTDELVGVESSEIDTAIGDISNAQDNVNKVINRL